MTVRLTFLRRALASEALSERARTARAEPSTARATPRGADEASAADHGDDERVHGHAR